MELLSGGLPSCRVPPSQLRFTECGIAAVHMTRPGTSPLFLLQLYHIVPGPPAAYNNLNDGQVFITALKPKTITVRAACRGCKQLPQRWPPASQIRLPRAATEPHAGAVDACPQTALLAQRLRTSCCACVAARSTTPSDWLAPAPAQLPRRPGTRRAG